MMFFSNIKSYVPIKLCKTSGSIHLFKLIGSIKREDVTLHRNTIWDILDILLCVEQTILLKLGQLAKTISCPPCNIDGFTSVLL